MSDRTLLILESARALASALERRAGRSDPNSDALPLLRLPRRPPAAAPDLPGAREALPAARAPDGRRRRGGAALDEVPAGARHDRRRRSTSTSSARSSRRARSSRTGRHARSSPPAGERRIRRSALEEIFTSLSKAGAGYHAIPRAGARRRAPPRDAPLRVRRQPDRDRRRAHDRQRRPPRRRRRSRSSRRTSRSTRRST